MKRNPKNRKRQPQTHGADAMPAILQTLEPRLLLSASAVEPIQNQDDFAEYLANAGLGNLEQYGITVTIDASAEPVSASGTEQTAALGEAGLVPVGTQPVGALTGKIVYLHAGHGRFHNGSGWFWQRPLLLELNEDMSNQDMMSYLAKFLWNAGATIVPLRPIGHQPNEIILDNDDTEVTFVGSWSNSSSTVFYGSPGDLPYRFASTSATETAYARYRPNITEEGFYPVYAWTRPGSDRVNQLYKVTHSGGTTEVSINHKRVGNGLVYLGTFHFEQGTEGYVDISNRNNESGVVIADAIRFGNGVGDIVIGGSTSGVLREDEPGVYWFNQNLGQGISTSEFGGTGSTVSGPPRFAEFMNRQQDGSLSDRVFISYHSNAGSGGSRGTLGLVNGNNNPSTATPNQFLLANTVAGEINDDLVALNGTFEHNWFNRSTHTLDRSDIEFGEINNNYINNEFDATIIEWAFHDNVTDTELMRDPKVRDAVARATYQGMQKYFNSVDGGATGLTFLPDPVTNLRAATNGDGTVTLNWTAPAGSAIHGGTPTGYMVYTSLNGFGFDGGTFVAGGATTTKVMTGLDSANGTHYFKVVAANAGGHSLDSTVVAATPLPAPPASKVLIVNGFDRNDRNQNERYTVPGGTIDRVRLRHQNTGDYAVQVAEAIEAFNPGLAIDTAQNENVSGLDVSLGDYDTVIWILGEESSADDTFSTAEQFLVENYINAGGDLFVTGAEIGWDLDNLNNGRTFYNNILRGDYVSDDAGTHSVNGVAGSIFAGLSFSFDDGSQFYDTEFPDVINPTAGATLALTYANGAGGAAIQKKGSVDGDVVMFGFPFETITSEATRNAVMEAVLLFFGAPPSEIPTSPNGLTATPGNNTLDIDWNDNLEPDILGYDIYRAPAPGGPFTKLNGAPLVDSEYTDNAVTNGTPYYYQVVAIDTDLNESSPSITLEATPDDHGNGTGTATPIAVPSLTNGHLATDDLDFFSMSLVGGTDYTFSVLTEGLASAELRLYTSTGTLITTSAGPGAGATIAEIQFSAIVTDTYRLAVASTVTGNYDLNVQETDDHGDSTGAATAITTLGVGGLQTGTDIDFFGFTATAGKQYDFNVLALGLPDAVLTLYNAGGAFVLQDTGALPDSPLAELTWVAPSSGQMYLSVNSNLGSLGDYGLTIAESDPSLTGDLDGDGFVGIADLNIVLGNWNQNVTPGSLLDGDPSGDGFVGIEDLNTVLGNWNAGTPPVAQAISTSTAEVVTQDTAEPDAAVTPTSTQEPQNRQRAKRQHVAESGQDARRHGLAIAGWRASERSAFGDRESYRPAFGLWEAEDGSAS